jgi:hypothetical protein
VIAPRRSWIYRQWDDPDKIKSPLAAKPLKYSFRSFLVYVKRLRIELNRECLDLRLVDRVWRTGKALIVVQERSGCSRLR